MPAPDLPYVVVDGIAYPRIPTLDPQQPDESSYTFGLRAFRYLCELGTAALLDTPAAEAAYHFSQYVIPASDAAPSWLERYGDLRLQLLTVLQRRAADDLGPVAPLQARQSTIAPADEDSGGQHDRLPVAPVRPTAPAAAQDLRAQRQRIADDLAF